MHSHPSGFRGLGRRNPSVCPLRKQVLCQSRVSREERTENCLFSVSCERAATAAGNSHMSNHCRRFRTTIMTTRAKPLIPEDREAVARHRQNAVQVTIRVTRHAGRRDTPHPACCSKDTLYRLGRCPEPKEPIERERNGRRCFATRRGDARNSKATFYFAHCRSFSTLHRCPTVSYTAPEFSLRTGAQGRHRPQR